MNDRHGGKLPADLGSALSLKLAEVSASLHSPWLGLVVQGFEFLLSSFQLAQLEEFVRELEEQIRVLGDRFDPSWLRSAEGQRLVVALAQASTDALQAEKIAYFAAGVVGLADRQDPFYVKRRLVKILVQSELEFLWIFSWLDEHRKGLREPFSVKLPLAVGPCGAYLEGAFGHGASRVVDEASIAEALHWLELHWLAEVERQRNETSRLFRIRPNATFWNAFAEMLGTARQRDVNRSL